MKYLVLAQDFDKGLVQELPIVFPAELPHTQVAIALLPLLVGQNPRVISAGDMQFDSAPRCSGGSLALDLRSRPSLDGLLTYFHDLKHGLNTYPTPNNG